MRYYTDDIHELLDAGTLLRLSGSHNQKVRTLRNPVLSRLGFIFVRNRVCPRQLFGAVVPELSTSTPSSPAKPRQKTSAAGTFDVAPFTPLILVHFTRCCGGVLDKGGGLRA